MHTPFLRPRPAPEVHGVYRNKETGKIMVLKNMKFQGFIDGETEEPYDAYKGRIWLERENKWVKGCIITPEVLSQYEKLVAI